MPRRTPHSAQSAIDSDDEADLTINLSHPDLKVYLALFRGVHQGSQIKEEDQLRDWIFGELLDIMEEARRCLSFGECVDAVQALTKRLYKDYPTSSWMSDVCALLPEVADPLDGASVLPEPTPVPNGPAPSCAPTLVQKKTTIGVIRRPLPVSAALKAQLKKRGLLGEESLSEVENSGDEEDESPFSPGEIDELDEEDVPVISGVHMRSVTSKARTPRTGMIMEVVVPLRNSALLKKTQEVKTAAKKVQKAPRATKGKQKEPVVQGKDAPPRGLGRPRKTVVDTEGRKEVRIGGVIKDGRRVVTLVDSMEAAMDWRALPTEKIRWQTEMVVQMCNYCRKSPKARVCLAVDGRASCKLCLRSHKLCQGVDGSLLGKNYSAEQKRDTQFFRALVNYDALTDADPPTTAPITATLVEVGVQHEYSDVFVLPDMLPAPDARSRRFYNERLVAYQMYNKLAKERKQLEDQMRQCLIRYNSMAEEREGVGNGSES